MPYGGIYFVIREFPDFVNEAPYRALSQTGISPSLAICLKKVITR